MKSAKYMEARVGIEPTNKGFADLLTSIVTCFIPPTENQIGAFCPQCARSRSQV